jgi:hypothetical protein
MSFQAMAWATNLKVGNATGKAILLILANYADESGACFPSQKRIADESECSVATAARWLKRFEETGVLERRKQYGEGGYRKADRLFLNLQLTELPSRELPNSVSILTRHSDGAEPVREPVKKDSINTIPKNRPKSELEKVLDPERAKDVVAHRKILKKPLTDRAAKLLADSLAKCPDPNAAADMMIERGWQSIKPEWFERDRSPPQRQPKRQTGSNILLHELLGNNHETFDPNQDHNGPTIEAEPR